MVTSQIPRGVRSPAPAQGCHGDPHPGRDMGAARGGRGTLTSSASLSSVSSLFSCWSFALFLKASFSGLPRSEGWTG